MKSETKYTIGDKLYVLVRRDARVSFVCGACEGAKTLSVKHADGVERLLPCGGCGGKGKLDDGKSVPVFDVKLFTVAGLRIEVGKTGVLNDYSEPRVTYFDRTGKLRDVVEEQTGVPRFPGRYSHGGATYFWPDKALATATAEAWTAAAQAAEAARRG